MFMKNGIRQNILLYKYIRTVTDDFNKERYNLFDFNRYGNHRNK